MTIHTPPAELHRVAGAARAGRLEEAAGIVDQLRAAGNLDPVLAALGGAVALRLQRFEQAVSLLSEAHLHHPDDITVRANLAEALYGSHAVDAARELCTLEAVGKDKTLRLARMAAFLAQEAAAYEDAVSFYRQILEVDPHDWSSWNNLGNALGALEQGYPAADALRRALELAPDSQPIQINLANTLILIGETAEAEALLTAAARRDERDVAPLTSLFSLYRDQGREDEAYAAITQAAHRAPQSAPIQSDLGQEASKRNDYGIAEAAFERALAIDPQLGPSYVGLASLYERMNRESELDPLLARANTNAVDAASIAYIEALLCKRSNNFATAFEALKRAGDVIVPGRKHHLLGVMLDRLGRYDEAFAAFQAMNQHWLEDPTQPKARAGMYRESIADAMASLSRAWLDAWSPPPIDDGRAAPIFLVGFPRSGTTLLDTMLMREPRALVMEEEPFLTDLETSMGGLQAFSSLSRADLQRGRDYYYSKVASLGPLGNDTIVVDKHPLHLNKVTTVRRFFPDARFILALRHPCDVLLSCYLTNFRINNAMSNFLDLEDAAKLYDLTFTHWETACALFELPVATVVYERLVQDTSRELRPLFDWLGLNWPGDDVDHRTAARARGLVTSASYAQVTEPIYQRAAGRWHRYSEYLAPVFDRILPWVDRFGYSLEDGRIPAWPRGQE